MNREESINNFLNGRYFVVVLVIFLLVGSTIAAISGKSPIQGSTNGACFSSQTLLSLAPFTSVVLNLVGILGVCALLVALNKIYSFIRHVTLIYVSVFLMLEVSNPYITTHLYDGTILSLVAVALGFIVFSTYQKPKSTRNIFLAFAVISACCTFQYAFLYLIPVCFVGFVQMRTMSFKGSLAMILGLITPFWILMGLGVVPIGQLKALHLVNVWGHLDFVQSGMLIGSAAVTALLTLALIGANMFPIYSYRSEIRAYNGFFTVLTIFTIAVMCIDYNNILIYLPVLNSCLAIQMAHFFTINKYLRRYGLVFVLLLACIAIYIWRITF